MPVVRGTGHKGAERHGAGPLASLLLIVAVLIAAVGCGDDGSSTAQSSSNGQSSNGAASTSPDGDFLSEANAACEKRMAELRSKGKRLLDAYYTKPLPARAMAEKVVIPAFEAELRDLEALEAPPQNRRGAEAVESAIRRMIARLEANPKAGNFYPYTEAEKIAAKHGLAACGQP